MNFKYLNWKNNLDLIIAIAAYLIIGFILINNYQYIINSDGISYISIAKHYLNGNFAQAINGYWSPLYSWLLIPFLLSSSDKVQILFSTKVLALIIGFFNIIGIYFLADKLNFDIKLKAGTLATSILLNLYFAFNFITPDLLVVCILIFYLNFLLDQRYCHNLSMGFLTGFTGALAFLSKSYIFFFFLVHFILTNLYYGFKFPIRRRKIIKNLILGLTVFFIISGVWVGAISYKYDKFTIGTAGSYNYAIAGPDSMGHPMYYAGLLKPPEDCVYSVWEDPSYLPIQSWSPFESKENFLYQLKIIWNNFIDFLNIIELFSIFSMLILFMAGFLAFKSSNNSIKDRFRILLLTILIYSGGYCLIFLEIRYLWFVNVLLVLLGFLVVKTTSEEFSISKRFYNVLILILCLSFIISPLIGLYQSSYSGSKVPIVAEDLKELGVKGNIASNNNWESSVYLAYYLDTKYYGQTNTSLSKDLGEELRRNDIKYYLIWGNSPLTNISGFEDMNYYQTDNLKVYYSKGV
ncbi:MAG: hypothetical protein BME94_03625 [Methanobacteriales archaeon Met13]